MLLIDRRTNRKFRHGCAKTDRRSRGGAVMIKMAFVLLASLGLAACATRTQTVGTTAGVVGGALVGGPVGAVVGGATSAVVAAPWGPFGYRHSRCYYHDRYGRVHYRWC